ncbi:uncharacterized protein LOC112024884 [Quercus suber]|uniref:uncharacterized protein LOC112024884 n=1 Tax=Quercus suber TaxID=58331 RepID=UPI000CE1C651|nr:uncharacterized protein LOC112024884 [Quercus suber]
MTESTSSVNPTPAMHPWENKSSPYFLSSGDNPGVSLVVQHLTKDNYNTWSRAILISLDAKTKLGFIDGFIPKPQSVDHPHYTAWNKCNSTILAWLFNFVSKELQSSIVYFKTAKDVWADLQNRFGQGNGPTIFDLTKEISSLVQEDLTINAYYANCQEPNSTLEPVPSLSKVFSLLLQDEKQRKVGAGKKFLVDTSAALAAFGSKPRNTKTFVKFKNGRPQCTHCGAMGHVVDKCFKLHGYPPGYKSKNKGGPPFANNVVAAKSPLSEPVALTKA